MISPDTTTTTCPYYRARYYDPTIGRFLSEDPIRFWGGIDFYKYVDNNPTNASDPSGKTKYWGNWCGPDWTGARIEQYDPSHDHNVICFNVMGQAYSCPYYAPPIDPTDSACKQHDICYFQARQAFPCDSGKRRAFMESCDQTLLADLPKDTYSGQKIQTGIAWHPADPGPDAASCGCNTTPTKSWSWGGSSVQ